MSNTHTHTHLHRERERDRELHRYVVAGGDGVTTDDRYTPVRERRKSLSH